MNKRQNKKMMKKIFVNNFLPEEDDDMCLEMFRDFYQDAEDEFSIHFEEITGKESLEDISNEEYDSFIKMIAFRNYLECKRELVWQRRIIKFPERKLHIWLNYGEEAIWHLDDYECDNKQEAFDLLTNEEQRIFVMHKYFHTID